MHDRKFPKHKLQMPAPHKRLSKDNRNMDVNTGKVIPGIKWSVFITKQPSTHAAQRQAHDGPPAGLFLAAFLLAAPLAFGCFGTAPGSTSFFSFEIDNTVVMVKEVQHELDNKNGEVKELLQQLENKIREVNLLQRELDNKNDEIKELKQPDDFIVNRLQGAWEGGFVAGRAEERSIHVLAPPICATSQ